MPTETSPESAPGRRWVIGAVGHRYLPRERLPLLGAISRSLSELIGELDSEPADVMLLVSVAEGADRLFIEAAASLGMPYTCVLPCSPECFEADFDNHASVSEFRRFLAGAQDVLQPETAPVDRIAGYLWASHAIIDRASALIAVWDGGPANGPAGTGDTIEVAIKRRIPVLWIPTEAPHVPVALEFAASTSD